MVAGLSKLSLILDELVSDAAKSGIKYVGFGMAHRGRLSALANVFDKPF